MGNTLTDTAGFCRRRDPIPHPSISSPPTPKIPITKPILFAIGNPGHKYHSARSNIGKLFLDHLATQYSLSWTKGQFYDYTQHPDFF
jgi:peptidyl-tRNA hydrolase